MTTSKTLYKNASFLKSSTFFKLQLIAGFLLIISGCTTAPPIKQSTGATTATNKGGGYYQDDGPEDNAPTNLDQTPDAIPKKETFHKFANRPYVVFGYEYIPELNEKPYRAKGIASWYGKKFKGKKTASGESYDMYAMTAAHRTLPIPSYVKVTNINNSKSVIVRVNDRGPFHSNRLIDLSYTAALKLGLLNKGSGQVEVERVFAGSDRPTPTTPLEDSLILAQNTSPSTPIDNFVPPSPSGHFLQLGAFSIKESAENLSTKIKQELIWLMEPTQIISKDGLYRVRLGPYSSKTEAMAIADKIKETFNLKPLIAAQ